MRVKHRHCASILLHDVDCLRSMLTCEIVRAQFGVHDAQIDLSLGHSIICNDAGATLDLNRLAEACQCTLQIATSAVAAREIVGCHSGERATRCEATQTLGFPKEIVGIAQITTRQEEEGMRVGHL